MLAADGWETVCLSTCNRTELYLASDDAEAAEQRAAGVLRELPVLYLWQERRLKRHEAGILRVRVPALVTLDDLAGRTIAFALPALTLGILAGLIRLGIHGGGFDALMGVTILTWAVYGVFLLLRYEAGWHGRKAAYLLLAGFALVIAVRLGLPTVHFS